MSTLVKEVMSRSPVCLASDAPVTEAAQAMRKANIGDVIVTEGDQVCGIVTDRDVVVRAAADGKDLTATQLREICSSDLTYVRPDTPIDEAVALMRQKAIRRLPVVQGKQPVGIVSLGDLAEDRDPKSALADISAAPPNS